MSSTYLIFFITLDCFSEITVLLLNSKFSGSLIGFYQSFLFSTFGIFSCDAFYFKSIQTQLNSHSWYYDYSCIQYQRESDIQREILLTLFTNHKNIGYL